jgi:hypothetical protein
LELAVRLTSVVLLGGILFGSLVLANRLKGYPLPGSQQGYEPVQPIAFSHRLHAGEIQTSCLYCHVGAEKSRHAGIPPANVCMTCHRFVTAPQKDLLAEILEARKTKRAPRPIVSPELQKLYDALALDGKLEPDPSKKPEPIAWVKVHNLPSFTCFDHRSHTRAGVSCQSCHGPVETMDRIQQVSDLSMGWCVNCHREASRTGVNGKPVKPSIDCATCHY